jgi:hypothetical protein
MEKNVPRKDAANNEVQMLEVKEEIDRIDQESLAKSVATSECVSRRIMEVTGSGGGGDWSFVHSKSIGRTISWT